MWKPDELSPRAAVDATLFMTFGAVAPANITAYSIIYFDSRYEVSSTQIRPLTQICNLRIINKCRITLCILS